MNFLNDNNDETGTTDLVTSTPSATETAAATPVAKLLSFTVVHGYLVGTHACKFELHATGCRDLKKMQRTGQASFEVLATDPAQAVAIAVEDGVGKTTDFWTQPCCQLSRMKAIGRA